MRRPARASALLVVASLGLAGLVVAGCGGDDPAGGSTVPAASDAPVAAEGPVGDAVRGQALAMSKGCSGCHDTQGRDLAGPTWRGLAGSPVELSDGSTVMADVDYLRRSITEPRAEVVAGFSAVMPTLELRPDEVDDLVAYIQSL